MNSTERGSGARFNAGKPKFSLLPLDVVTNFLDETAPSWNTSSGELVCGSDDNYYAQLVVSYLGEWQAGNDKALTQALVAACHGNPSFAELEHATRVIEYGAKKYAPWNWAKGMAWSIPLECAVRHARAIFERGELIDDESKQLHRGHIQCNLLFLLTYTRVFPEGDDRPRQLRPE